MPLKITNNKRGIMKKLFALLLLSTPCYAGLITHTDYVAGQVITASAQNTNENTIVNEINGNLDNTNISAGGITTTNLASAVQAQFVPTGSFFYWVGSTNSVPSGYLYCDGTAVNRTTYAALFNVIGTSFGTGNGSTTFNLPDTRGYFVRGMDSGAGRDTSSSSRTANNSGGNTGDKIGSVEVSTMAVHSHGVTDPGHAHRYFAGTNADVLNANGSGLANYQGGGAGTNTDTLVSSVISTTTGLTVNNAPIGGTTETRPININMAGIIKY